MTQEEKQLLLTDLCARLPYGVKCRFETTTDKYKTIEFSREGSNGLFVDFDELYCYWLNDGFILPYLRPMSSMTEEEKKELSYESSGLIFDAAMNASQGYNVKTVAGNAYIIDYLIAHHIDYRGLIEKGLAIEAPEGMY